MRYSAAQARLVQVSRTPSTEDSAEMNPGVSGAKVAVTLFAAACAEEVSPFGGGGLAFRDLDVSFTPRIVYSGWKGQSRSTAGKDACSFAFDLSDGPGGSLNGRLESRLDGDGAVAARWAFTPSTNVWVEECGLLACLPVYRYADGNLEADGTSVHLAKDYGKALQFRGRVSKLAFRDAHGRETFALAFPEPADVLVQDSRGWKCPWFELRILLGHRFAAGKTVETGFRLIVPKGGPVKLNPPGKYVPAASEEWRPIAFPSQVEPGSAVDFTSFAVSHTPAGKYGYAVVRDGHFEFEKLPGVPQRFYGINVCYGDCYPDTPEKADGMAACGTASTSRPTSSARAAIRWRGGTSASTPTARLTGRTRRWRFSMPGQPRT